MIRVRDLSKTFPDLQQGEVVALDSVSFDVAPGEIFGLLGPNGAGKTTCLRLLATILSPTAGTASIDGHDIVQHPGQVRSCIGFLSGTTGLYDRMTARETVEYFGRLHGLDEVRLAKTIHDLFTKLSIHEFADTLNIRLSTGMRQKVSIARALVHDPPVLIFDEPTRGIDVGAKYEIYLLMNDLAAQGKAIIMISSELPEILGMSDRILVMHEGRVTGEITDVAQATQEQIMQLAIQ